MYNIGLLARQLDRAEADSQVKSGTHVASNPSREQASAHGSSVLGQGPSGKVLDKDKDKKHADCWERSTKYVQHMRIS